jgi:hypothetical protein
VVDEVEDDKWIARILSTFLVGTRERTKSPGRPRYRSKDNTLYSDRMGGYRLYFFWVHIMYEQEAVVATEMNRWFFLNIGNILTSQVTISF